MKMKNLFRGQVHEGKKFPFLMRVKMNLIRNEVEVIELKNCVKEETAAAIEAAGDFVKVKN